jgi:hypothetical protein
LVEAPLEVSVPFAPPLVPELDAPLGALELDESLGAVAPPDAEPYCFMHSSRVAPVMPTHWLGTALALLSLVAALGVALSVLELPELEVPELEVLGELGAALVSDELVLLWAHAALANAIATAAAITLSVISVS